MGDGALRREGRRACGHHLAGRNIEREEEVVTTYFEVRIYDHPQDDRPMTYCTSQLSNLADIMQELRTRGIDEAGGVELTVKDGERELTVEVRL
jgi:hypothetical protein